MATDSISEWKAELEAAVAKITEDIDGVSDLVTTSVSFDLINHYRSAQSDLEARRALEQQPLDTLNQFLEEIEALKAHGYPTPQTFPLNAELMTEHTTELKHIEGGAKLFVATGATHAAITFGEPVSKPSSRSSQPKE